MKEEIVLLNYEKDSIHSSWFTAARKKRPNDIVIYCFAHAGGNSEDYLRWQSELPNNLLLKAVILPGTGRRYLEKYPQNIETFVKELSIEIGKEQDDEIYLFGHSMGAILAFEVSKKLLNPPRGILVSASLSPSEIPSPRVVSMSELDNESLIKEMKYFNSINFDFNENNYVINMIAEKLKRDFKFIVGYKKPLCIPNDIPIMVISGTNDKHISISSLIKWKNYSNNFLGIKHVEGDHFYFIDNNMAIINAIIEMINKSQNTCIKKTILI